MSKSFIDVVQDSPRTGLGIPVKTKKDPSLEPIHRPRNHLSALTLRYQTYEGFPQWGQFFVSVFSK